MKLKLTIIFALLGVILLAGCVQNNSQDTPTTVASPTTTIQFPVNPETETVSIELLSNKFVPDTIEVNYGKIVVLNLYSKEGDHTFTIEELQKDIRLPQGTRESIQFLANKVGTFEFYCRNHPNMRGTLIIKP